MGKVAKVSKQKIREIYEALPKLNCGFCGFGSCGQFARAVAEVDGRPRQINVFFTPEVKAGDHVLLDNGYAMRVISEQEALEIFELLEEISKAASD